MDKLNITLKPDQKIFFSSDQHFGHRNVVKFCSRPYADEKEMGKALIENWNNVVGPDDIIVTMGDFFWFNDSHSIKKVVNQLNGTIYIVLGNHDKRESFRRCDPEKLIILDGISHIFLRCEDENRWYEKTFEIVCTHYPLMTWSHRDRGAINLFGHIHSGWMRSLEDYDQMLPLWRGQQLDVGVDNQNFTPVVFEDVLMQLADEKRKLLFEKTNI
jgi:calcineurin-like phosphoesterase family protein